MMKPRLTICIPSFNRLPQAIHSVRELLRQIQGTASNLIVLDNGSADDYVAAFSRESDFQKPLADGTLQVRRNASNIGMSANFVRAFEVATGDWLWLLSDDDDIRSDSVQSIYEQIGLHGEESAFIKFSSPRHRPERSFVQLRSFEEFVDFNAESSSAFNGFIFISNVIYRLDDFRDLLGVGYQYAHTYVPHFMMLAASMERGHHGTVTQAEIVDYVVPEVGYSYGLVAGLGVGSPKHILLKVSPSYYRRFLQLFFPHNDFKVIIDLFFHCKRDASDYVCQHLVNDYLNYVSIARSFPKRVLLRCFGWLLLFPWLFERLVGVIGRLKHRVGPEHRPLEVHISEIRTRYS